MTEDEAGNPSPAAETTGPTGSERLAAGGSRLQRLLFGDRAGLALFLGVLCAGGLFWRPALFLSDNTTLVQTLEALADGRVHIDTVDPDGGYFRGPGAEVRDGRVYGRNYGQVAAALPALWVLQAVDAVANLRVALLAGWHLVALSFVALVGRLIGRRRLADVGGGLLVLASFGLNVHLATTLADVDTALLALQMTTLVFAAATAVVLYRLLAGPGTAAVATPPGEGVTRRLGLAAGAGAVVVLPVGFWATVPKRHVASVLACLVVVFLLARSRTGEDLRRLPVLGPVPLARAGAYATVGVLTWTHAAEGLVVFLALVAVDLPTAPSNDRRSIAFVGSVFALSLAPTVVTNLLVTGEIHRPPRAMGGSGITDVGGGGGTGGGDGTDDGLLETLSDLPLVGALLWMLAQVVGLFADGLRALADPERVYHTLVRSEGADLTGGRDFRGDPAFAGANLSMLEVAPLFGAAVAALVAWVAGLRHNTVETLQKTDPSAVLAGLVALGYVLLYLPSLPLYAQYTQRYLLPVFPLALYVLVRSDVLTGLLERTGPDVYWAYAGGILVGGQLVLGAVVAQDQTVGASAQQVARLALLLAATVAVTTVGTLYSRRFDRPAAVALGLGAAAGTVFMLVSGLYFFAGTGELLLPVLEELATRL